MNSAGWSSPHPSLSLCSLPIVVLHWSLPFLPGKPQLCQGQCLLWCHKEFPALRVFLPLSFYLDFTAMSSVKSKQKVGIQRQPWCLRCSYPPHYHRALRTQRFPVIENQDNKIQARNLNVVSPSQGVSSLKISLGKELDGILSLRV